MDREELSTDVVLGVVRELSNLDQPVRREGVQAACQAQGLTQTVIDERLRVLTTDGVLYRLKRGEYKLAYQHREARAVTKSYLPDGTAVLEIGDKVLQLTPQEDRMLAALMGGAAAQLTAIDANYNMSLIARELGQRVNKIERESASLVRRRKPKAIPAPAALPV